VPIEEKAEYENSHYDEDFQGEEPLTAPKAKHPKNYLRSGKRSINAESLAASSLQQPDL